MPETPAATPPGDPERDADRHEDEGREEPLRKQDTEWEALREELAAALGASQSDPAHPRAPRKRPPAPHSAAPRPRLTSGRRTPDAPAQAPAGTPEARFVVQTHRLLRDVIVAAAGDLDAETAPLLRRALAEAMWEPDAVRLLAADLRAARIADDVAWLVLIETHRGLAEAGRRLFVALPSDGQTARQMTRLGLDTLLTRINSPADLKRLG